MIANGQISSSAHHMSIFSFLDDKLSKCQLAFTKLSLCIDIVDICFGIANGKLSSVFELSTHHKTVMGYYCFRFLLAHLS